MMGGRVKVAARRFLHEVKDGGNFEVAVEVSVSLKPASTYRLANESVLNHLELVKCVGGNMSKRYRRVCHDWPNASFVKCHLIPKGQFTTATNKRVETT